MNWTTISHLFRSSRLWLARLFSVLLASMLLLIGTGQAAPHDQEIELAQLIPGLPKVTGGSTSNKTTPPVTPLPQGLPPSDLPARAQAIAALSTQVDQIDKAIQAKSDDESFLVAKRTELEKLIQEILATGVGFRPRIEEINARLTTLGAPPAEGQPPEAEIVTTERQNLNSEKAEINATLGQAEDLSVRAHGLIDTISAKRRELFAQNLSRRYDIGSALNADVGGEFVGEMAKVERSFASWISFVFHYKLPSVLVATGCALIGAVLMLIGGRRLFAPLAYADPAKQNPSYLSRLSVAFWSTFLSSGAFAIFLAATWYLFKAFGVMRGDIGAMLAVIFAVLVLVNFVSRLAVAVLSPHLPNWRLFDIRTSAGWWLVGLIVATSFMMGLHFGLAKFSELLRSSVSLAIAKSLVSTSIIGLLVVLIGLVRPFENEDGTPAPWPRTFRYLLFFLGGLILVMAALGYVGFAGFVAQQIVMSGSILAMMALAYRTTVELGSEGVFSRTSLGKRLKLRHDIDGSTEDQIGFVLGILINGLVLLIGIPFILLQWGFHWADLRSGFYSIMSEVKIGSISISLIGVLTGIAVFFIGYFLTRVVQRWLDTNVMARGRVDTGVRNSVRTVIGYVGYAIAAIFSLSVAGIDFSNLALVAGALSLGLGFGLQNIVNNFVSGLILLVERPFKTGDWIVAGQVTGTVRKISVRATEVETFQRQTMILPNSELINAVVGNWTHRNKLGRLDVKIAVAFGSDLKQVNRVLADIARSNPLVLKNPEPIVAFIDIGEYAMHFELRVFLADISNQITIGSELRESIIERFGEEGIGIPVAQRSNTVMIATPHAGGTAHLTIDDETGEVKMLDNIPTPDKGSTVPKPQIINQAEMHRRPVQAPQKSGDLDED